MKFIISLILLINIAILKSQDILPCGKYEEFRCDYPCEKTCDNLGALIKCVNERHCHCFCIDGYVRDRNGRCIPIDACPTCHVNQTYQASGIDCLTCRNYKYVRCALRYERKCYCLDGYVLDETTGYCKLPQDCPRCCGDEE